MKNLKQFTGLYPVSKTLRFELKPEVLEGQTIDDFWNIYLDEDKKDSFYNKDKKRNDDYPKVKLIIDQFHKNFISSSLGSYVPDSKCPSWDDLYEAYCQNRKSKEFSTLQDKMREGISNYFKKHEWWEYISSYSKLIGDLLKELVRNDDDFVESIQERDASLTREKMLEALNTFDKFSVYFGNYKENRDNMYKKEAQSTSIANRIVNENFPKFMDNIFVYHKLKEICPKELKAIQDNLKETLKGMTFDEVFTPSFFNECLTQEGIEKYNWILGGNPNQNVLGVNSVGNEYLQHHPESNLRLKELVMSQLYKQILSDRVQPSFLPEQYKSENELMESLSLFFSEIQRQSILETIGKIMNTLIDERTDLNRIYVQGSNLTKLSHLLYSNWNLLGEKLRSELVTSDTKKAQKERDQEIEKWLANKCFSLSQILKVEKDLLEQVEHPLSVMELLSTLSIWKKDTETHQWKKVSLIKQCQEAYVTQFIELRKNFDGGTSISTDESKQILKEVLDKYMELLHVVEFLRLGNKSAYLEKDGFYVDYEQLFVNNDDNALCLSYIIPLYNKVRSYLTRKISSEGKMLLKFDSPTRANGWNDCSIIIKNNHYYLLMYVDRLNQEELSKLYSGDSAKIVSYQQQKTDYKNAPRLFINSKGVNRSPAVSEYKLPIEMVESLYKERKGLSSKTEKDTFSKEHPDYEEKLIDYYKIGLFRHKDFAPFRKNFESNWKKSSVYNSIQEFFEHTQEMCYMLTFESIDFDYLYQLQTKKKVFLFSIYNKDFKEDAKGTPNMHTLYWKELFTERNLKDVVFKLSSQGVEFFYRSALQNGPKYVHKRGSILVNKTLANGTPINNEMYKHFVDHFNGKGIELTTEEAKLLPQVRINKAKTDIMKDRRYYEHKFYMHVPVTINFKASGITQQQFNERTLDILRKMKKDINIIGIDRGERNLIYVSVINQKGENIIPPKHYNLIETKTYDGMIRKFDYLEKLIQTGQNRDAARKNWTAIEKIKDLKSGYLSQVVHEISKLVVKYNAIVVMEDLNFGFKRGRFNVERQVYQNFEKMLIQKLNYLSFKTDAPSSDYGNIWNGLQLTAPFTSFKELGKQSGWLFYVPASYTSKIDPTTGFVNLFNMNKPAKDNSYKTFFGNFKDIRYKNDMFYFTFDYSNDNFNKVRLDYKNEWTLSTHGERIVRERDEQKVINLTQKFKDFFSKDEVNFSLSEVSVERIKQLDEVLLKELFGLFKLLMKMRNTNDKEDYIISPVAEDRPFKTGENNSIGLYDADANGAYNIALKGLYWVMNDFPVEEKYLKYIKDTDWFEFLQTKPYLND